MAILISYPFYYHICGDMPWAPCEVRTACQSQFSPFLMTWWPAPSHTKWPQSPGLSLFALTMREFLLRGLGNHSHIQLSPCPGSGKCFVNYLLLTLIIRSLCTPSEKLSRAQVKGTIVQPDTLEFKLWDPHSRREGTPASCHLAST